MRRPLLILAVLAALAAPAAALSAHAEPGDGTLVVRNASGDTLFQPVVGLSIVGAVVGDLDRGKIVFLSSSGPDPVVTLPDGEVLTQPLPRDDGAYVYQGSGLRFRAVGGAYRIRVYGRGVDVNAVGQGRVWLDGSLGTPLSDGKYSLNGGAWTSLPAVATLFQLRS